MILSVATYNCFVQALGAFYVALLLKINPIEMLGEHSNSKLVSDSTPFLDFSRYIPSAFIIKKNQNIGYIPMLNYNEESCRTCKIYILIQTHSSKSCEAK